MALSIPVVGYFVESNIFFSGTADGKENGTLTLQTSTGARCVGEWRYTSGSTGLAGARCSDGRQVEMQFTAKDPQSGTTIGSGFSSFGERVVSYAGQYAVRYMERQAYTPKEQLVGLGSGFFVSEDGALVTNAHVVQGCSKLAVWNGERTLKASKVALDIDVDLAVLRVNGRRGSTALFARTPEVGETIYALGYPLGVDEQAPLVFQQGMIASLSGFDGKRYLLQHSAPLNHGNSGGPLLDSAGNVTGVNVLAVGTDTLVSQQYYAIKSDIVRQFLSRNGVRTGSGSGDRQLSSKLVFKVAKQFTARVHCYAQR
ncbi:S1C family serine protease [Paraburkholderia sp.]|uniref:S1C family serine protease n=1 Tax=Paraburkholderia sp. TaxID=1926495 RepID=UPI0025EED14D|nr:S1C family serine protease [Paraburkholderia sp.]